MQLHAARGHGHNSSIARQHLGAAATCGSGGASFVAVCHGDCSLAAGGALVLRGGPISCSSRGPGADQMLFVFSVLAIALGPQSMRMHVSVFLLTWKDVLSASPLPIMQTDSQMTMARHVLPTNNLWKGMLEFHCNTFHNSYAAGRTAFRLSIQTVHKQYDCKRSYFEP